VRLAAVRSIAFHSASARASSSKQQALFRLDPPTAEEEQADFQALRPPCARESQRRVTKWRRRCGAVESKRGKEQSARSKQQALFRLDPPTAEEEQADFQAQVDSVTEWFASPRYRVQRLFLLGGPLELRPELLCRDVGRMEFRDGLRVPARPADG
jgi:hypothetical protein